MPTVPDTTWMVGWAEANNLEPNRVIAGSVEIVGEIIWYDRAFLTPENIWGRHRTSAPLVIGFSEYREEREL